MDEENTASVLNAVFCIGGRNWDPDDCTRAIGLTPTGTWRQNRSELRQRQDLETERWFIRHDERRLYSTDDAVLEVLDLVWPARARIIAFVKEHGLRCNVVCHVKLDRDPPIYELAIDTIRRLAEIGAGFDLDIDDLGR